MGYGIQFYYLPYAIALIWITNKYCKIFIYIFTPIILLVFGFESNPIFDYLFAMWSFLGFLFVNKQKMKYSFIMFISLLTFIFTFIFNSISGVIFYKTTFLFSIAFNGFFNFINFLCFVLFLLIFLKTTKFQRMKPLNINEIKLK
ncbi:MAG: hypothetical protein K2I36_02095 [Ureaplasma sp.]|nr:hypothetical protein [Ureaplasma sp.]